jgi:D-ribose pyranase
MKVEKITLAKEINKKAPELKEQILRRFGQNETAVEFVKHEQFKKMTAESYVVIRTGETTPYANIILTSGVTF